MIKEKLRALDREGGDIKVFEYLRNIIDDRNALITQYE